MVHVKVQLLDCFVPWQYTFITFSTRGYSLFPVIAMTEQGACELEAATDVC